MPLAYNVQNLVSLKLSIQTDLKLIYILKTDILMMVSFCEDGQPNPKLSGSVGATATKWLLLHPLQGCKSTFLPFPKENHRPHNGLLESLPAILPADTGAAPCQTAQSKAGVEDPVMSKIYPSLLSSQPSPTISWTFQTRPCLFYLYHLYMNHNHTFNNATYCNTLSPLRVTAVHVQTKAYCGTAKYKLLQCCRPGCAHRRLSLLA